MVVVVAAGIMVVLKMMVAVAVAVVVGIVATIAVWKVAPLTLAFELVLPRVPAFSACGGGGLGSSGAYGAGVGCGLS